MKVTQLAKKLKINVKVRIPKFCRRKIRSITALVLHQLYIFH